MKPGRKPSPKLTKSTSADKSARVSLSVVSDKERQAARIPTYAYILP